MHVAMIIDNERLTHEKDMLKGISKGLIAKEIEVSWVVPEDLDIEGSQHIETDFEIANQIEIPMAVGPWLRKARLTRLSNAFSGSVPDVIYLVGKDTWRVGLDLAQAIDIQVAIDVWSMHLLKSLPLGRSATNVGAYIACTNEIAKSIRRRRIDRALVNTVAFGVEIPDKTRNVLVHQSESIAIAIMGSGRDIAAYKALLSGLSRVTREFPQLQICLELRGPHQHDIWRYAQRLELLGFISAIRDASHHANAVVGCDVLVIPERFGDMRSLMLKAMAYCVPIVASQDRALEMLAKDENAIIIDSPSTEQWSKHLTRLLSHPDLARQLGIAGRKRVAESFGPNSQIEGLLETFQKTLSGDAYSFA